MFVFHESKSDEYVEVDSFEEELPFSNIDSFSGSNKHVYETELTFDECMRNRYNEEPPEEDKRLANWWNWLERRKRLHASLGSALNRKPPALLMNRIEGERYVREEKDILDLARIYAKPDKYRGSPYFWQPPVLLSNKGNPCLPDCEITLSKRERGIVGPIEYVSTPIRIRKEKHVYVKGDRITAEDKWNKSEYLKLQKHILRNKLKHIENHKPQTENLVIEGKSILKSLETIKKLSALPGIREEEEVSSSSLLLRKESKVIPALSLKIQDVLFCVTKRDNNEQYCNDKQEFNFTFEAHTNQKTFNVLKFENICSVKFTYWWKQLRINSKLPLSRSHLANSSFFFNKNDGLILPGQIVETYVWFHSRYPGVFEEVWELTVSPQVIEDFSYITLRLWGIAETTDTITTQCKNVEAYLFRRQQETAARETMEEILTRMCHPDPPLYRDYKSKYLEEKYFLMNNPGFYYHPSILGTLEQLYREVVEDPEVEWDMDLRYLRELILKNSSDRIKQSEQLNIFCTNANILLAPCHMAHLEDAKYSAVRDILCHFANNLEKEAEGLKTFYPFASVPKKLEESDTMASVKSIERVHSRRQSISDKNKSKRKISGSKGVLVDTKQAGDGSNIPISKSRSLNKTTKSSINTVDKSTNSKIYAVYREALFVKVYCHLGVAVEQISAVLDSIKTVDL